MNLTERIAKAACRHVECSEERVPGSLLCGPHLTDDYMGRLDKLPDGTFVPRRRFVPRDRTGELRSAAL